MINLRGLAFSLILAPAVTDAKAQTLPPPPAEPKYKCINCNDTGTAKTESTAAARKRRAQQRERQAQFYFEDGLTHVDKGDWDNAIRAFLEALDETPDDPEIEIWLQRARTGKRAQLAARSSLSKADLAGAANALSQGMDAAGVTFSKPTRGTLVALGAEVLGEEGLMEFQRANIEYRRAHKDATMFRGSAEADRRYIGAKEGLKDAVASLKTKLPDVYLPDTAVVQARINQLIAAAEALEKARATETPATIRSAADEWRQAVLHAGMVRAVVVAAAPLAVVLPDTVSGEYDHATVAFIREMERICANGTAQMRNDPYCPDGAAYFYKARLDQSRYAAWRNAEHYLFMKGLGRHLSWAGGLSGSMLTPVWSIVKYTVAGRIWGGSQPSKDEMKWGYYGAVVGMTGKFDPTKEK